MSGDDTTSWSDQIVELLRSMRNERYGERVDMLDHSLQTAARAIADGASDHLVLAALLHDVGHLLGDAGEWGLADHAQIGAAHLRTRLPAAVVEPIRLHVDAKRYLVATDDSYADQLSEASIRSLDEQGGPFSVEQVARFEAEPYASEAIRLRRWDDAGKVVGESAPSLDDVRQLLERVHREHVDTV